MSTKTKEATLPQNFQENAEMNNNRININEKGKDDSGYVKQIFTEQDVYTSGVVYRYINNIDPNKDLITDTAKMGGPLKIEIIKDA